MIKQDLNIDRKGTSIAFYSYKGGVGRSMALVNIACLLAKKNKKILIIDWDVEAPGLHLFFNTNKEKRGLVDLITDVTTYVATEENNNEEGYARFFAEHLVDYIEKDISPLEDGNGIKMDLLKAGKFGNGYSEKLTTIDWQGVYKNSPALFRTFAYCLEKEYDYVLIDSRTGLADSAGITTLLMPGKLVLVFALNHQNIDGVIDIAKQAIDYRLRSFDYRRLDIYPLPARIERGSDDLRKWIDEYSGKFETLFREKFFLDECNLTDYFDRVSIPYFPAQAHGENIPVLRNYTANPNFISFYYNSFLTVLLKNIYSWEVISIEQESTNEKSANELIKKLTKLLPNNNYLEQINLYDNIIELAPDNYLMFMGRAIAKKSLNDFDGALADFICAIELAPSDSIKYYLIGVAKREFGNLSDASSDFDKAYELTILGFDSDSEDPLSYTKAMELGNEEAKEFYEQILEKQKTAKP